MEKTQKPVVQVIEEKCVNCHRCIAVCPVKMCNNGSGSTVVINSELCIGCGACIQACTHGARRGIDDAPAFFDDVQHAVPMVAIIAPATASNFEGRYKNLAGWLSALGVRAFFDVSFGAELTVMSYLHYKKEKDTKCIIAQPCPALVTFMETYKPELLSYLIPVDSPMLHTMKMIRTFYPEYANHKIVVISPCYAKRREFDEVGIGDYNVTFRSLTEYLEEHAIDITRYPEVDFINPPAERAVLFSSPGGILQTVEREIPDIVSKTRRIEGPEVYHYFENLEEVPIFELIDCLSCSMGCNGGPGTLNVEKNLDVVEKKIENRCKEAQKYYKNKKKLANVLKNIGDQVYTKGIIQIDR
jgi:iron only hydrogenase large subunit-like protein